MSSARQRRAAPPGPTQGWGASNIYESPTEQAGRGSSSRARRLTPHCFVCARHPARHPSINNTAPRRDTAEPEPLPCSLHHAAPCRAWALAAGSVPLSMCCPEHRQLGMGNLVLQEKHKTNKPKGGYFPAASKLVLSSTQRPGRCFQEQFSSHSFMI